MQGSVPQVSSSTFRASDGSEKSLVVDGEKGIADVDGEVFPEGGYQAWLTVLGAFLIQFTTFGYINSFGVYQDFYVRRYLANYSPSDIGWIGGIQIFCHFSSGIFVGRAFDRGKFYSLILTGAFLNVLALFMLSLSQEHQFYQVFLTNGVALGLSGGLCYIPSLGIAAHYFKKRRPLAMGIISSGCALGAIVHPIMLNRFFNGPVGFHRGIRISGAINALLLLVACSIVRTRLPPRASRGFSLGKWLREPSYFLVFVGIWFISLGVYYPVFYLQLAAITHGVDPTLAFYSLPILNAASVLGRIIPGALAPKLGALNLSIFAITSSGIVIMFMGFVNDVLGTVLFAIFYGVLSGWGISLFPSVIALLSKNVDEFGTRLGICFLFQGFIGLFASPIAGALLTDDFHWIRADLFSGSALVLAGFLFAASRHFLVERTGTRIL